MTLEGKPLHVQLIKFKDGRELRGRDIAIEGAFIVVACRNDEDKPAVWYAQDTIDSMYGIDPLTKEEAKQRSADYALYPCVKLDS